MKNSSQLLIGFTGLLTIVALLLSGIKFLLPTSFFIDACFWYSLVGAKLSFILFIIYTMEQRARFLWIFSTFIFIAVVGMTVLAYQYKEGDYILYLSIPIAIFSLYQIIKGSKSPLLFALIWGWEYVIFYQKVFINLNTPLYLDTISLILILIVFITTSRKTY